MSDLIGTDEVGYGSLIGNLVVVGIRAANDWSFPGLKDSKQLSSKQREELCKELMNAYVYKHDFKFYIAERSNIYIDEVGIYRALKEAHLEAIQSLYKDGCSIIVDGSLKFNDLGVDNLPITSMVKADTKVPHVMASSIIAKTHRDAQVIKLSEQFPQYGWDKNFGYGTQAHLEAIKKYGVSSLHRKSYEPIKSIIQLQRK